jgi:hypothetical protein
MTRTILFMVMAVAFVACDMRTNPPDIAAQPAAQQLVPEEPTHAKNVPQEKPSEKPAPPATVDQGLSKLQGELDWVSKRLPKENER